MGVLFVCGDFDYSCAYGSWSIVRMEIFRATLRYMKDCQKEYKKEDRRRYDIIRHILSYKNEMTDVDKMLEMFNQYPEWIELLKVMDLHGMFVLMDHPDDQGYYTPGNAMDILITIKIIEPFIEDENTQQRLNGGIKKLFKTCKRNRENIVLM